ncbi:MAG: hypothetical protein E7422_02775 [Ruminococcaceae bacterium]|jgi:uncharacterized protein HemX|nr:hypothetical protein [Oscillospiraceae bacterium]
MTDFIHEHPRDEKPAAPTPPPAPEAPLDEKTGQKRVYGYIFILFIVAFGLLLWSFLMNQRSTDQVLSELRGSTGTLQSTLDRNVALEQQNEALEAQIRDLEAKVRDLEAGGRQLEEEKASAEQERDALKAALEEAQAALKAYETEAEPVENP